MSDTLRNAGVLALIFAATLIYYFVANKADEIDLSGHMNVLGERLLNLVPEGNGKEELADEYAAYAEKVKRREVAPEVVERVAANIINVVSERESLTPEEAIAIFRLAVHFPEPPHPAAVPGATAAPKPLLEASVNWQELDKRMGAVLSFSDAMAANSDALAGEQSKREIHFRVEDNLQIVMDQRVEGELKVRHLSELAEEVQRLEQQKLLRWQDNWQLVRQEMRQELKKAETELQQIILLENGEHGQLLQLIHDLTGLDSISIEGVVDVDSILLEVKQELREEGIEVKINE